MAALVSPVLPDVALLGIRLADLVLGEIPSLGAGQEDHVHMLIDIHPALSISILVNNLKSASSRRVRNKFAKHIAQFYWKPYFWNRAYYVGSVGNVTLDTIMRYVQQQGTKELHPTPKVLLA
jgi:hypothetical protein